MKSNGAKRREDQTIEELREELARQILMLALEDSNPQYKLDSYKATQKPPERGKHAEVAPNESMSIFQERVRKARDGANQ